MVKKKSKTDELRVPLPPSLPPRISFPEYKLVRRVGFNNLTIPLQLLVVFGWIFLALVIVNAILAVVIYLGGV